MIVIVKETKKPLTVEERLNLLENKYLNEIADLKSKVVALEKGVKQSG